MLYKWQTSVIYSFWISKQGGTWLLALTLFIITCTMVYMTLSHVIICWLTWISCLVVLTCMPQMHDFACLDSYQQDWSLLTNHMMWPQSFLFWLSESNYASHTLFWLNTSKHLGNTEGANLSLLNFTITSSFYTALRYVLCYIYTYPGSVTSIAFKGVVQASYLQPRMLLDTPTMSFFKALAHKFQVEKGHELQAHSTFDDIIMTLLKGGTHSNQSRSSTSAESSFSFSVHSAVISKWNSSSKLRSGTLYIL